MDELLIPLAVVGALTIATAYVGVVVSIVRLWRSTKRLAKGIE